VRITGQRIEKVVSEITSYPIVHRCEEEESRPGYYKVLVGHKHWLGLTSSVVVALTRHSSGLVVVAVAVALADDGAAAAAFAFAFACVAVAAVAAVEGLVAASAL